MALVFGVMLAVFIGEVLLRVFEPIKMRVRGNRIFLPLNQKYAFSSPGKNGLSEKIIHTKNSLGFRGSEKPADWNAFTTIITVGGSTTECFYLSDGKDWPSLLGKKLNLNGARVWMNNAGLDGHSTFGNNILLNDYLCKLKPEYILYLVGANDVEKDTLSQFDKRTLKGNDSTIKMWLLEHSEIFALADYFKMIRRAKKFQMMHGWTDFNKLSFVDPDSAILQKELMKQSPYLKGYEARLTTLVNKTIECGIIPVLITQPTLIGRGNDDITGIDLETVQLKNPNGGNTYWQILEKYNDVTRRVAAARNIRLIDLARAMPKSTRYYYDYIHYNNEGAELVSEIIFQQLKDFIK